MSAGTVTVWEVLYLCDGPGRYGDGVATARFRCLARCAKVLRIEEHPAVRAAAQHAETIPAPAETG